MHIVNTNQVSKEPVVSQLMTGPVWAKPLAPEGSYYNCRVIIFEKGIRNKYHAHDSDQILIAISGRGLVATESEQQEVGPGDVIFFSAGEKHWHGATADSEFAHIYVHLASAASKQLEE